MSDQRIHKTVPLRQPQPEQATSHEHQSVSRQRLGPGPRPSSFDDPHVLAAETRSRPPAGSSWQPRRRPYDPTSTA